MARSSFEQSSFLGGEWGPLSQGRSDDPRYTTAMNVCMNGVVTEEGSATRRSGTMFICPTRRRTYARLLSFDGSDTCSFGMEYTDLKLRFVTQSSLICDDTAATISAVDVSTGVVTLDTAVSWTAGDGLMIVFPDASSLLFPYPQSLEVGLRNRVLTVGVVTDTTHISLGDDLGAILDHSAWPSGALVGAQLLHVVELTTPYTGVTQLSKLRAVQDEFQSVILSATAAPHVVQVTKEGSATTDPHFSFDPLTMIDGPYLNPQTQSLTLSALTGAVTATAGSAVFTSTDVGRLIRIFTQPADWAAGTTYASGATVTDATGAWWVSLAGSNTGNVPGTAPIVAGVATAWWGVLATAGSWAWGTITGFTSSTIVTVTLDATIPGMVLQTANGLTADVWQLGVYSGTTGYPTCGGYQEGRLWLGGVVKNRFDTTVSNGVVLGQATFSPTDPNGNVLDDSGISEVLNSKGLNQIQWFAPDHAGMLIGTLGSEFLVSASAQNDPITPTDIQQHEATNYGSLAVEPRRAGMAVLFVQKYGRRLMEYLADAYSGKFSGRHLNEFAKHMSRSGIADLAYQEEPVPIVWVLMNNGLLAGVTYRRFSRFVTTPPEVQAWHWHPHGGLRVFTNMCALPGKNGLLDRLMVVTQDAQMQSSPDAMPENYYIEIVQPVMETDQLLEQAWLVDQAPGPGPGNSGYDCGGGQPAAFHPTGPSGFDSFVPSIPALNLPAPGGTAASPPAGGLLALREAAYFPGTVMLYDLPKFPGGVPPTATVADQHSISMSVWLGLVDFPLQAGALLSSPALTFAETTSGTKLISGLLSGRDQDGPVGLSNAGTLAFIAPSGATGAGASIAPLDLSGITGGLSWLHLMVSAKDNGAGNGTMVVTAAVNDTMLYHNDTFSVFNAETALMWPFATQRDQNKENGLSVWAIGGADASDPVFDKHFTTITGPPQTITIPSLLQFLAGQGETFGFGRSIWYPPTPAPYFGDKARTVTITNEFQKLIGGSGGIGNSPLVSSIGSYAGYRGSVAELWIKPGTFVDWSDSANRYKFHEFDTVTDSWGPVSLGDNGQAPFGTPWIYLSGPPATFTINRVTGKKLTTSDAGSEFGGLLTSPLNFPN